MASFEFIARAVILSKDHVLLCQNKKRGYYYLPGGHVEFSESAADAAGREMIEETGLRVRIKECLLVEEHSFTQRAARKGNREAPPRGKEKKGKASKRRHEINVLFRAEFTRPRSPLAPVRSRESHIDFAWVPVARLGSTFLRPAQHALAVRRALRRDFATRFDSRTNEP